MFAQRVFVSALTLGLATGCAHKSLIERGRNGWRRPEMFWPPPRATSLWRSEVDVPITFGDAALRMNGTLKVAGYADTRWYPVGAEYTHGFATVTKLERITDDGHPADDRWLSLYPEASNLFWLL